jgi:tetratricopeptide (TPR) repeat protein
MKPPARPSVFVSYNQHDRTWAEWIAWILEEAGHPVTVQAWDFRPGSNFVLQMDKAAKETDKTVVVLSDNYLKASFTQPEWAATFAKDPQGWQRKLMPVRVRECSPDGLLGQIVWIDLVGLPEDAARAALLQGFEARGKPLHAPAFPGASQAPERRSAVPFPGEPRLHNLPYPRLGDLFTGRQEELDALAGEGTAAITQSLSGLGGIGKTRLAVEHAWRSGDRYTAVWFVRADSPENLRRNLAALAAPALLNLPERTAPAEAETVGAVLRWLQEHPGWLMILDNVDTQDAADAVLEIVPTLSRGRALITSRLASWPPSVRVRSLDTLSSEEATHFLLQRTEGGREKAEDDGVRACELTQLLDGLPLALEQAAAYIVRHRLRLADYIATWEQKSHDVLSWYDKRVMQYPSSVATTWQQTFEQLGPTAATLLRLTAFWAPDPILIDMLEQGAEHIQQATALFFEETGKTLDQPPIRTALADLAEYSLISRQDGGTMTVHRVVQEVLRNQIPEERRKDWVEKALWIVNDAADGDPEDVRTWPVWSRLQPHASVVMNLADHEGISDPTSRLMNHLATLFYAKGLYSQAELLVRRTLDIDKEAFGEQHPQVAIHLNNLALLLQDTNRLEEAEPLMRRALDIDKDAFGEQHPKIAIRLNNLAQLLKATNRLAEADPLMRRALEIWEKSLGADHPRTQMGRKNLEILLAEIRQKAGDPAQSPESPS